MIFTRNNVEREVRAAIKKRETKDNKDFNPMVEVFLTAAVYVVMGDRPSVKDIEVAEVLGKTPSIEIVEKTDKNWFKDLKAWNTFLNQDYSFQEFVRLHAFVYLAPEQMAMKKIRKAFEW